VTVRRPATGRRDPGVVSGFVVSLLLALLLAGGMVVDVGRILVTREELSVIALRAGRTGAQEIVGIHSGSPRIDPQRGGSAASDVLRTLDVDGDVAVDGRVITVAVTRVVNMTMLGLIGVPSRSVTVVRSVEVVTQ